MRMACLGFTPALSVTTAPLTCDHFVGKTSAVGQPTRPTQPSIPPGLVNEYWSTNSMDHEGGNH